MKKRVLLTGGSGFIGKNILESGLTDRYEIFAPGHTELDLMNEDKVSFYLKEKRIDVILHAAAKPGHRNAKDPTSVFYTNTRMFFNLARNSKQIDKMIIIGSGAIYDNRHYCHKMTEDYFDAHVPLDEHGMSKYVIEKYIEQQHNIYDLRVFGIYGKYEDYSIRFISNMICKALFDLPLTINQNRIFDYIFVEDLFPILEYVIESDLPWTSMNVTPDVSNELVSIAKVVLKLINKDLPIVVKNDGFGLEYTGSNDRLRSILPDLTFTELDKGIVGLLSYYRSIIKDIDIERLKIDK